MRTITYCGPCAREHAPGDYCDGYTEPDTFPPRTLTLSFDAIVTIRIALQRERNWLEEARQTAISVGRPDLERRAEFYLNQNQEALNELET